MNKDISDSQITHKSTLFLFWRNVNMLEYKIQMNISLIFLKKNRKVIAQYTIILEEEEMF